MNLMIVESPGKVEKLKTILGEGWRIVASIGHIRDLPTNEMGVAAPNFVPEYVLTERGEVTVQRISNLVKNANHVYLATDPDREGESISWHLKQCLKLKEYTRVTFNEVTEQGVKKALENPRLIDMAIVAAQETRRILDRLVGYMVSPALSDVAGTNLSAGRVQSVAVLVVAEREREILAFRPTKHFGAKLFFADAKNNSTWFAEWQKNPVFINENSPYFLDREFASQVSQCKEFKVLTCANSETFRNPPPPFTTSTLQQASSVTFSFDPAKTMEIAQKLFDEGHITYHRTDNPNISLESFGDIVAIANKLGLDAVEKPRLFSAPDGAQAGHPAVTPTHWEVDEAGNSPEEKAIYKLIRIRAIASQLAAAKYSNRTIVIAGLDLVEGKELLFEGSGKVLVFAGWKKLIEQDQTEENDEGIEANNPIPELVPGTTLTSINGELIETATRAPKRYTQASLIKKLEGERIGRPATYATIMENILNREYVTVDKKYLKPTERGFLIVDLLRNTFNFMDINFTRELESDLDLIAHGNAFYKDTVQKLYTKLETELLSFSANSKPKFPCPSCGKSLRRRKGSKGDFWGCAGYPNCTVTLPDEGGKPGQAKSQIASEFKCEKCGDSLNRKNIKGGFILWTCSGQSKGCKAIYANVQNKPILQNK